MLFVAQGEASSTRSHPRFSDTAALSCALMSHPDVQGALQHLCDDAQTLTPFTSHPDPQVIGDFNLVWCSNKNHMVSFRKKMFDI